jgi:hypothetical protein
LDRELHALGSQLLRRKVPAPEAARAADPIDPAEADRFGTDSGRCRVPGT